ncbi:hypothetical protein GFH48_28015 [Streptomyces fagopyri]|uniref:Uncharacterized protein n=1 Tax=Streptomyces fagopyri TaxID=2662397 RepID=A0A5Q0LJG0_9ACTN|nr:hypothetical protein GFH48_28015 [Streptomyces fagopyri]
MLNRIRRALSLTRRHHSPKDRHRRALASTGPTGARARSAPVAEAAAILRQHPGRPHRMDSPTGPDILLVRPYVLAWEERRRPRHSMIVAPHLPPAAWSLLAGGR